MLDAFVTYIASFQDTRRSNSLEVKNVFFLWHASRFSLLVVVLTDAKQVTGLSALNTQIQIAVSLLII